MPISQNLTIVIVTAEVSGDPPDTPAEKEIICLQKKPLAIRGVQTEHKIPLRVDYDWTACSLGFKEILIVPGINWFQIKIERVDFLNQPEETNQLSE